MRSSKALLCLILCTMLTVPAWLTACGSTETQETTADTSTAVETGTEEGTYVVPDVDYEGSTFTILNMEDNFWDCYNTMDVEAITGEPMNDAVFNRNATIEKDLNVDIQVSKVAEVYNLNPAVSQAVATGDAMYDVTYVKPNESGSLLSENMLYNLYDINNLQLDQAWWDQIIKESLTINDHLFFISSPAHLMAAGLGTTMYFNKGLMSDFGLEAPYDIVREGKWTMDLMHQYMETAKSMGTQSSWAFDENGDATYGVTLHNGLYVNLIYSSGEQLVTLDADGQPQYTAPSERYYSIVEKLASMVATKDGWALNQHDGLVCQPIFKNNRTLFHYWELKETSVLRDMEEDYGVLPSPKFDETQDSYYSMTSHQSAMMAIPVTNTETDMAGTVMDYMSYLSNESLWPAYLDVTVINKGLRDEDSVEMMTIIRETLGIDVGLVYGWSNALTNEIGTQIKAGDAAIASLASSYTDTIRTAINESLTAWNN